METISLKSKIAILEDNELKFKQEICELQNTLSEQKGIYENEKHKILNVRKINFIFFTYSNLHIFKT